MSFLNKLFGTKDQSHKEAINLVESGQAPAHAPPAEPRSQHDKAVLNAVSSVGKAREQDRDCGNAANVPVTKRERVIQGVELEQFLILLAQGFVTKGATKWPSSAIPQVQAEVIEIARYHLAGFFKKQILAEIAPQFNAFSDKQMDFVYEEVAAFIANNQLQNAETGEGFRLEIWDVRKQFDMPGDRSIDQARTGAICTPLMGFVKGDYPACVKFGMLGAAAFGRPMFFHLWIIGCLRLKNVVEARAAAEAAQNCLQVVSPWHSELVKLTLGDRTAKDLMKVASDETMFFQVRCFEALRLFTNGDIATARDLLNSGLAQRSDLLVEPAMMKADLARTLEVCRPVDTLEQYEAVVEQTWRVEEVRRYAQRCIRPARWAGSPAGADRPRKGATRPRFQPRGRAVHYRRRLDSGPIAPR